MSKRPDFQAYRLPVWVTQPCKVKRPEQLPTRSWDTDQNITDIFFAPFPNYIFCLVFLLSSFGTKIGL